MIKANIGNRIKKHRELNQLTQTELAKTVGVSRQAISSWELNRTEPSINDIEKMARVFGCQKSDIIDGEKEPIEDEQIRRLVAYAKELKKTPTGTAIVENMIETMKNITGV